MYSFAQILFAAAPKPGVVTPFRMWCALIPKISRKTPAVGLFLQTLSVCISVFLSVLFFALQNDFKIAHCTFKPCTESTMHCHDCHKKRKMHNHTSVYCSTTTFNTYFLSKMYQWCSLAIATKLTQAKSGQSTLLSAFQEPASIWCLCIQLNESDHWNYTTKPASIRLGGKARFSLVPRFWW